MDDGNKPQVRARKPHVNRVQVLFTDEQLSAIDAWAMENGLSIRNEAIRALILRGMK